MWLVCLTHVSTLTLMSGLFTRSKDFSRQTVITKRIDGKICRLIGPLACQCLAGPPPNWKHFQVRELIDLMLGLAPRLSERSPAKIHPQATLSSLLLHHLVRVLTMCQQCVCASNVSENPLMSLGGRWLPLI